MFSITAKYFSENFTIRYKLKLSTIVILEYIYSWLLSDNPPESKIEGNKRFFYISQSHIANDYKSLISQGSISLKLKEFKDCGIIKETQIEPVTNKYFVSFDWDKVIESLAPQMVLEKQKYKFNSNWFEKIFDFIREEKELENREIPESEIEGSDSYNRFMGYKKNFNPDKEQNMAGLLDDNEMKISKPKYPTEADSIAKRILIKYPQVFITKYPKNNEEPTKTYTRLCQKITDIYNGHFINSRFYNFDQNVFNNKQFETSGWREKIKGVQGDWSKVKKLIFDSIKNYILMFEEDRMPMKKDYLTNNLNDWFFSDNPNNKGQSLFIQSLNEPMITKQKLGLDKAKNIVKDIKEKSPISYLSGHELNELLPENANEVSAWSFIQDIIKWGKLLYQYDENAKYFLQCEINKNLESGPKVLPALFARYLKDKEISVSLNTLNIEQAIDSNAPWCWFIQDSCKKHGMNPDAVKCLDENDFYDAYNKNDKLTFNDMEEVIF